MGRNCGVAGRSLHLIDLENVVGNPDASCQEVDDALDAYLEVAAVGADDLVTVAVNHRIYKRACFSLDRGWEVKLASGPDACDHVLLDEAPVDWVVDRFDRLVVGSGDGIFEDLVLDVRDHGRPVWVVSQPRSLSRRLAAAASRIECLRPVVLAPDPVAMTAESGARTGGGGCGTFWSDVCSSLAVHLVGARAGARCLWR